MTKRKTGKKNLLVTAKKAKVERLKKPKTQESVLGDVADSQPTLLIESNLRRNTIGLDCQAESENHELQCSQVASYRADQGTGQGIVFQQDTTKDDHIVNDCPDVVPQSIDKVFPNSEEPSPAQSLSPPSEGNYLLTRAQVHSMPEDTEVNVPCDSVTEMKTTADQHFEDLPDVVLSQHSSFRKEIQTLKHNHCQSDVSEAFSIKKDALSSQITSSPAEVTRKVHLMQLVCTENNSWGETITSEMETAQDQLRKDNVAHAGGRGARGSQHISPNAEFSSGDQNYFVHQNYLNYVAWSKPSSFAHSESSKQNCPLQESFQANITPSDSSFCSTNYNNEQAYNTSPVIRQCSITPRPAKPKTPDNQCLPMSLDNIFSPNTKTSIKSTIQEFFPELVNQSVIPVKKRKKSDVPYIVDCTKRKRIPEKLTLDVFKGDKYGITSETNAIDDEKCTPRKRGRRPTKQYPNWSKSKFNPKSDEIAARLKLNEKVDELLRKSPSKESASFMTKPYSSRPQAFSPLPSTSRDNETIMKNEKHFKESLNYDSDIYDIADDEELPEVIIDAKYANKGTKKKHVSLFRSKDIEILNKNPPIVINEDLNNNNDIEFEEFDFTKIKIDKYTTETTVKRSNSPANYDDQFKPNQRSNKTASIIDTIEINDYHDNRIGSLSDITPVIDVDNYGDCNASKENTLKIKHKTHNEDVSATSGNTESVSVIELPDIIEPAVSNHSSIKRVDPKYFWNEDIEFVSEIPPSTETVSNELRQQNNANITPSPLKNDIENVVNGFFSGQSSSNNNKNIADIVLNSDTVNDFQIVFSILTDSFSRYRKTKRRNRKHSSNINMQTSNKPPVPRDQPQQQAPIVNNENADPSANARTTPTNGERRLGDCPICMENLSTKLIGSTTCGHVFCLECIKTCLRTAGKRCPTCRKQLKGVGYHQVFL